MITDEQVEIVSSILAQGYSNNDDRVRKALEAYEQSKWVKFDVNDESTYPKLDDESQCPIYLLNQDSDISTFRQAHKDWINCFGEKITVTHWQSLPEFKE